MTKFVVKRMSDARLAEIDERVEPRHAQELLQALEAERAEVKRLRAELNEYEEQDADECDTYNAAIARTQAAEALLDKIAGLPEKLRNLPTNAGSFAALLGYEKVARIVLDRVADELDTILRERSK